MQRCTEKVTWRFSAYQDRSSLNRRRSELAKLIDRGDRMSERQCGAVGGDQESAGSQLDQGCKDRREIEFGARVHDMELQPEDAGRSLRFCMQVRKPTSITLVNIDQVCGTAGDDESVLPTARPATVVVCCCCNLCGEP